MLKDMSQINTAVAPDDRAWLESQAQRLGVARSEVVRRAIAFYREHVPVDPVPADPTPTTSPAPAPEPTPEPEPPKEPAMTRPRTGDFNRDAIAPRPKMGKYDASNPLPPELRVEPPRTQCARCGATVWADESGQPKSHLRAATPADPDYDERVPVRVECA